MTALEIATLTSTYCSPRPGSRSRLPSLRSSSTFSRDCRRQSLRSDTWLRWRSSHALLEQFGGRW